MFYFIFQLILYYILTYIVGGWCLLMQVLSRRKRNIDLPLQTGKVAIVTGGGAGIGFDVSKGLVAKNVHVIIGGKCEETGKNAIREIRKDFPNAKVDYIHLDLESLKSVREFAETFLSRNLPLHILINNAGIMFTPYSCTVDGYESQLQVNFLSHFYLTQLLLDRLVRSGTPGSWSRIVNVSTYMHYIGNPDIENMANRAYADSKLMVIAGANMLSKRLREDEAPVSVCSLHPGVVRTNLFQHVSAIHKVPFRLLLEGWAYLNTEQGAETTLYAAISPEVEGQTGCYYDNSERTEAASLTYNEDFQNELWTKSILMIENAGSS
ncbi:dehydrogenase/reductase SDR family member on chromosome X-like isoform X2 [Mercenaria mercenaria]|uniref:dehydrogenase/reductase SDR family member on chromosome X-like isoform X2 n=1 Tax=Mercenaria mercenaria TaxID=6596 RepID=UPI00234F8A8A|nr:dehydrogenase/reductase SDR family member on chromosome X-like isoform X2 [Mercenaria mercenaria]